MLHAGGGFVLVLGHAGCQSYKMRDSSKSQMPTCRSGHGLDSISLGAGEMSPSMMRKSGSVVSTLRSVKTPSFDLFSNDLFIPI